MKPSRAPPKPLDGPALERMALRYVERFATTQGKLAAYLMRKVRERGWNADGIDPAALAREIAARMTALGYVDDRLFAESKAAALGRRGMGARRVADALRAAHVAPADAEALAPEIAARAGAAALRFARRRRVGPFGPPPLDRAGREKQMAAMLRAGHPPELSRRIVDARSVDEIVRELEGSD